MLISRELLKKSLSEERQALFDVVIDQIGIDWDTLIEYPEDYRNAQSGVSGFIYYTETEKFAQENYKVITSVLHDFEEELGSRLDRGENELNWLAWFALETIVQDIMDYRDNNR